VKAATAWALGQLGRHTPDHAKAVADTGEGVAASKGALSLGYVRGRRAGGRGGACAA
jgi:hypothetical protein